MRTDGVHCRESVDAGPPVVLKVVPAHGFIPVRDKDFLLISCNIPADVIGTMSFDGINTRIIQYILSIGLD